MNKTGVYQKLVDGIVKKFEGKEKTFLVISILNPSVLSPPLINIGILQFSAKYFINTGDFFAFNSQCISVIKMKESPFTPISLRVLLIKSTLLYKLKKQRTNLQKRFKTGSGRG